MSQQHVNWDELERYGDNRTYPDQEAAEQQAMRLRLAMVREANALRRLQNRLAELRAQVAAIQAVEMLQEEVR